MNQLLLAPTDVLFFRDGRPMGGSSTGQGAAWPLPTVTNAALHSALWRSGLATQAHPHGRDRPDAPSRAERFGSLTTAGPFPVCTQGDAATWFYPRPLDADCFPFDFPPQKTDHYSCGGIILNSAPASPLPDTASSSPLPLTVASLVPPTKDTPAAWWSEGTWNTYLGTAQRNDLAARLFTKRDADFSDREAMIGIAIDSTTGTTGQGDAAGKIYSAHYLRLRDGWNLGLFAETQEKTEKHGERLDLIPSLVADQNLLLVGGQQRLCTAHCKPVTTRLPLPIGLTGNFSTAKLPDMEGSQPKHLVKWVLLSPAIFPQILATDLSVPHTGGWLPSWIRDDSTRAVLLRAPLAPRDVTVSRDSYRARMQGQPTIAARLVGALTGKPLPVTGWSLGTPDNPDAEARAAGAKSTHLAVPAGSVYYFACDTADAAIQLAAALNWHGGDTTGTTIRNRRSTLLGEKGFGLGVCGTWQFHA